MTEKEKEWCLQQITYKSKGLFYVDNLRFTKLLDPEGVQVYLRQKDEGCCGSKDWMDQEYDSEEYFLIGFNYGH